MCVVWVYIYTSLNISVCYKEPPDLRQLSTGKGEGN